MNILAYLAGLNSGGTARHVQPRRPTGAALRNPSHPAQAARIEAAAAKRERRAVKAESDYFTSLGGNTAHHVDVDLRKFIAQ